MVNRAVIPATGFGTRFLPVPKAQMKEMMPVLDKLTIQYVVKEAVEAGIDHILIITGRGKQAIKRHLDKSYELEQEPKEAGKTKGLTRVQKIADPAEIDFVRQSERNGLNDTVLYTKNTLQISHLLFSSGTQISRVKIPVRRLFSNTTKNTSHRYYR